MYGANEAIIIIITVRQVSLDTSSEPPPVELALYVQSEPLLELALQPQLEPRPVDAALQRTEEAAIASLIDELQKASVNVKLPGRTKYRGGHSLGGEKRRMTLDVGIMGPLKAKLKALWLTENTTATTAKEKRTTTIKRAIAAWESIEGDTVTKAFNKALKTSYKNTSYSLYRLPWLVPLRFRILVTPQLVAKYTWFNYVQLCLR
ncbi:hypothetical protein ON010_g6063 [Phytophthora cinnamomi]|nr:hypothetical protein ON010_g6063 [Phytophthora cinnamomi]